LIRRCFVFSISRFSIWPRGKPAGLALALTKVSLKEFAKVVDLIPYSRYPANPSRLLFRSENTSSPPPFLFFFHGNPTGYSFPIETTMPPSSERSNRKGQYSCNFCRTRKLRCDRPLPCTSCRSRGKTCQFEPTPTELKSRAPSTLVSMVDGGLQQEQQSQQHTASWSIQRKYTPTKKLSDR
jgi:hypothetical protein